MDKFLERLQAPIVISEQGVSVMNYSKDFRKLMRNQGKRDPWSIQPKRNIFEDKIDEKTGIKYTSVTINPDISEADIIAWEDYRDKWIKERDELLHLNELLSYYHPCGSQSDSQCNLECKYYNKGCAQAQKG